MFLGENFFEKKFSPNPFQKTLYWKGILDIVMAEFIKGLELCRGFFADAAKPILDEYFPDLCYSAGLIGYGSDVLGYDDPVSRDHMWGPRFYMFVDTADLVRKDEIFTAFARHLPYEYKGYSVNFTEPDPNDNGVQHPKPITSGPVNPLIFLQTFDEFLTDELGTSDLDALTAADWLTISEHRFLSLTVGMFFEDGLGLRKRLDSIRYYPENVRRYRRVELGHHRVGAGVREAMCGRRGRDRSHNHRRKDRGTADATVFPL